MSLKPLQGTDEGRKKRAVSISSMEMTDSVSQRGGGEQGEAGRDDWLTQDQTSST